MGLTGVERRFRAIHECSCNVLPRSHPEWVPATLAHEASSLFLLLIGLLIAAVILRFESCRSYRKRRRRTAF